MDGKGSTLRIFEGRAENTAATISNVATKLLAPAWMKLNRPRTPGN
jgi:hypothetical protein